MRHTDRPQPNAGPEQRLRLTMHTDPSRTDAPALVGVLDALRAEHVALAGLVGEQRARVEQADARGLSKVQDAILERLGGIRRLDARRRALVEAMTGSGDTRLEQVTAGLGPEHREAATEIGAELRTLIAQIREEQRVIREAATHLMGHMQGLTKTMNQSVSHAGVYGRTGRVEAGATVVSGVDMTS